MLQPFQDTFILVEVTLSHFFRVTTSRKHLLFRISYLFRADPFFEHLLFQDIHYLQQLFFRITTFSERNFYRAATL